MKRSFNIYDTRDLQSCISFNLAILLLKLTKSINTYMEPPDNETRELILQNNNGINLIKFVIFGHKR